MRHMSDFRVLEHVIELISILVAVRSLKILRSLDSSFLALFESIEKFLIPSKSIKKTSKRGDFRPYSAWLADIEEN